MTRFKLPDQQPLLIVISGPSGVGKDSLLQCIKKRGLPFHFVVTATTRPPRENEVHGVDYFFVSKEKFAQMIEEGELMEYALVYNDYKGIPKQQVRDALKSGKDVMMRVDVQGAATVRKLAPEAVLIFLVAESEEQLVERLKKRGGDSAEDLNVRIATAREEMGRAQEFDYIIVNAEGRLEDAADTVIAIIRAEHHRAKPRRVSL